MISLYESILSSTKSGKASTVLPDLIDAINSINDLKDVSVIFSDRFIQIPKSFTKNEIYSSDSAITFSFKGSTRTTVWKYIKHFFTKHDYKEKYTHLTEISGIKDNQVLVSQEDTFSNNQEEYILVYIFKIENLYIIYIIINLKEIGILQQTIAKYNLTDERIDEILKKYLK